MKTLIISDYGVKLRFTNGVFIVEGKNMKEEYSPINIDQIIIATSGVSITSRAIRKIMLLGIDLVFLDSWGKPIGRLYPSYVNRTVETRRRQYEAFSTDKHYNIVYQLIYSKLSNQAGLLKRYYYITRLSIVKEGYNEILSIRDRELEQVFLNRGNIRDFNEEIMKIEAEAARIYWSVYSKLVPEKYSFDSRDQDSSDPVNVLLNYGYGVLYKDMWKALVLAGLDPYAGFLHVDRSGKPVLVYDFVEQFRFIVDLTVLRLIRRKWEPSIEGGLLSWNSRKHFLEALEKTMDTEKTTYYTNTPITLRQAMKKSAFQLASFLRDESVFKGFIWEW